MRTAALVLLAVASTMFGPPHLHVTPASSTPAMNATAFTLEVEHHTRLDQLSVTGRAETVRNGKRVTLPLTLTRTDSSHFIVKRTWEAMTPWVLVFAAEQWPNGTHGVVEAIVSIDRAGAVKGIEYTTPGFVERSGEPRRVTRDQVQRTLRALLQ
jgi:hypothetical protein